MKNITYKELNFSKLSEAKKKVTQMKKMYGYTPKIFKINSSKTKSCKYIIAKPTGLKKVN